MIARQPKYKKTLKYLFANCLLDFFNMYTLSFTEFVIHAYFQLGNAGITLRHTRYVKNVTAAIMFSAWYNSLSSKKAFCCSNCNLLPCTIWTSRQRQRKDLVVRQVLYTSVVARLNIILLFQIFRFNIFCWLIGKIYIVH